MMMHARLKPHASCRSRPMCSTITDRTPAPDFEIIRFECHLLLCNVPWDGCLVIGRELRGLRVRVDMLQALRRHTLLEMPVRHYPVDFHSYIQERGARLQRRRAMLRRCVTMTMALMRIPVMTPRLANQIISYLLPVGRSSLTPFHCRSCGRAFVGILPLVEHMGDHM